MLSGALLFIDGHKGALLLVVVQQLSLQYTQGAGQVFLFQYGVSLGQAQYQAEHQE